MGTYLKTGVIDLNGDLLPIDTLKFIYKSYKKSGVEVVDIFYQEGLNMYIGAESYETNMVSLYKINLNTNANKGQFSVSTQPTATTGDYDEDDFDLDAFNILDNEENRSIAQFGETVSIVEAKPIIKFTTMVNFIDCITLSKNCRIVIDENISIRSDMSEFHLPLVPSSMTIDKYTEMMDLDAVTNKWEKVNTEAVKLISNVASRTKKNVSDMYVSIEDSVIYSDNKDVIFETSSWSVKNNYTFNYSTIESLRLIPSGYEVKVAKHRGRTMLKVEDVYFGWEEPLEINSENIMSYLNVDEFEDVISIDRKEFPKFNIMEDFTKSLEDRITITVLTPHHIELRKGANVIILKGKGRPGVSITVYNSKMFVQLLKSVDSESPIISIDPSMDKNPVALIKGSIRILTSIEDITIDEERSIM